MVLVDKEKENATRFKEICEQRSITPVVLNKCINVYAAKQHISVKNVSLTVAYLKQALNSEQMKDKTFAKALAIIGLTAEEITTITTPST